MTTKKTDIVGCWSCVATVLFSLYSVRETEFVLVTQFGRPVRTVANAGLHVKWAFQSDLSSTSGCAFTIRGHRSS